MSTPVAQTESHSQRRRVVSLIKSISIWRLPTLRQRSPRGVPSPATNGALSPVFQPVSLEPQRKQKLENAISNLQACDAASGTNEQLTLSVGPRAQETKKEALHVDKHAPVSTSPETADSAASRTDANAYGPATSQPQLSSLSTIIGEDKREKLVAAETRTARGLRSLSVLLRRKASKLQDSTVCISASQSQPVIPSTLENGHPLPEDMQLSRQDGPITLLSIEGNQPELVDAKAGQTATESEEIEKLRRDLSDSQSRIAELQRRCEAQSRDLENSNVFLNTADKSSDLDIILALQRLNAEVQQTTTYMADYLTEYFEFENLTTDPDREQVSAIQRVSDHIGQVLAKSLGTKTTEDVSMLLQIAFQTYLASVLCQTVSSWCFEPGYNALIDGIYERLHRAEAQAISGRWRSLARFHNVHTWIAHTDSLIKGIITSISDIALAAGCTALQSDIISKATAKFGEKITLLVSLAGRLNKMFDDVISSDFQVFLVRPGEKFEDKNMDDVDGEQSGIQVGSVLCATHLGLMKQVPAGTLWEKGKKQKVVVLKAKVLLEAFLTTAE